MKAGLAIAALLAVPITATADEPAVPVEPGAAVPPVGGPPGDTPSRPAAEHPPADPAYGERPQTDVIEARAPPAKDVVIVSYPERSKTNLYTLGGLAVGGVIASAIGIYFHLDSRDAADAVGSHKFTGEPWTPQRQDTYDRAHSSSVTAGVFYGIGGALLVATAVAYIATEPKSETLVIHPHADPKPTALVAPTHGGALVGGVWSF